MVLLALAWTTIPARVAAADPPFGGVGASGHDQQFDFNRYLGGEIAYDPTSSVNGIATRRYERLPAVLCHDHDNGDVAGCQWLTDVVEAADCPKNAIPLDPLFMSTREVEDGQPGDWSPWTYLESGLCLTPADLKADVTKAFKSLTVKPSPVHVQPGGGQVLINMFTVTYTDQGAETFNIKLGKGDQAIPVEVQAVPTSFTWSYGSDGGDEGSSVTTTDPGKPYPDQTVTHTYTHAGPATLDLSTTWTGRFRIEGLPGDPNDPDTWTDIPGEAHTTSPTVHLNVYEKRPHLVEDTLP
ncbi:hypothetical protein [Luteimicrobium sp. DT211]|uniref:hypothetical protein n=1 Tax=Luteimicrobium sp. DT211 TaxID=3393412 RepID=UPI003CE78D49